MPGGSSPLQYKKDYTSQIHNLHKKSCSEKDQNNEVNKSCAEIPPTGEKTVAVDNFTKLVGQMSCEEQCPLCATKVFDEKSDYEKEHGYINYPNTLGICRGHSITSQKFNMLGHFCQKGAPEKAACRYASQSPQNAKQCELSSKRIAKCATDSLYKKSCETDTTSRECEKYYLQIIRDIHRGKARAIPGFKSLAEFSSHPAFHEEFVDVIKTHPKRFTARGANLTEVEGSNNAEVFREVMTRVEKHNEIPYIGLTGGVGSHAVTAYKTMNIDGQKVLCIRDPNLSSTSRNADGTLPGKSCQNHYMKLVGDRVIYMKEGKSKSISRFKLYDEEDGRNMDYAIEQQGVCKKLGEQNQECINTPKVTQAK